MNAPAISPRRDTVLLRGKLLLVLLFVAVFALATRVEILTGRPGGGEPRSPLELLLGDARKMFANHFFVKADVYFHSGFYPTMFDKRDSFQTPHMSEDAGAQEGKNTGDEHDFLGEPLDWIESLGRKIYIGKHTHLDEGWALGNSAGREREIMPWIRISAELDPQNVRTYMVAAYWLRERMAKPEEAEKFLREGLLVNPGSPDILFELGRIYDERWQDSARARNIWELALRNWDEVEGRKAKPDTWPRQQLLAHLARLDERTRNYTGAIARYEQLLLISPNPEDIRARIEDMRVKQRELPATNSKPTP